MVTEVIRQSNELQKCLLSFWNSRTWGPFSSMNEVPVLDIKCPTYSTSLRPSLVFARLAVTFFSRSLPSTLRVLPRYSLSSMYQYIVYISRICVWHSMPVLCLTYYVERKGLSLWVPWWLGSIQTVHTEWWKPCIFVNEDAEVSDDTLRWNQ